MSRYIDNAGKLLITCGFSGSGKSTLVRHALYEYPSELAYMNTLTTRPRRENEDEVEYTFVSQSEYDMAKLQSTAWDESIIYGNYYGLNSDTYIDAMIKGKSFIVCSVASGNIVDEMEQIYGKDKIKTIHLTTQLDLAIERLNNRGTSVDIGRLAIDKASMSNDFQPDYTFETTDDLGSDKLRFAKLVGEIING